MSDSYKDRPENRFKRDEEKKRKNKWETKKERKETKTFLRNLARRNYNAY